MGSVAGKWTYKDKVHPLPLTLMPTKPDLQRFIDAQEASYSVALAEITQGRKRSHWMWYIFPQIKGLGFSETAQFYALQNATEAEAFLTHPVLGSRLVRISTVLLELPGHDAHAVFGSPDDVKLRSSMTLFASLPQAPPIFQSVLDKYYAGQPDPNTLRILAQQS
jgi:uncharacterized protein (DUF1810 family)